MSKEWIRQRKRDAYYRKAKKEGYPSRAAYKLKQMNSRLHLLKKGSRVLDVGAAPGGWSKVASEIVGESGRVVAVDLVSMDAVPGVEFVRGDITEDATVEKILEVCPEYDAVVSDASMKLSGNRTLDRGRGLALAWSVMKLASKVMRPGGSALVKMFQGEEMNELKEGFGDMYRKVERIKPRSSLKRSIEIYMVFRGFEGRRED